MLDPRRLRLLSDVAATGTIAAAATRAGCTAAAASQQLTALEREAGTPLLERSARSVRLTTAGRVLVEHAARVLAELESAERAVRAVAGLTGGTLRVAAFATAATSFVIPALTRFRRRHPSVALSFTELESDEALPEIRAGRIDLAITHEYAPLTRPDLRGLTQHPLYREPLLLAVPSSALSPDGTAPTVGFADQAGVPAAGVPAAGVPAVRLAEHAGAEWIAARDSTGFQAVTEMACRAAGFEPRISFRVHSYQMVLALVGAGFGVAIVPRLAAVPRRGVAYSAIERPAGLARQIHATTRAGDRSPAAARLLDHLGQALTRST